MDIILLIKIMAKKILVSLSEFVVDYGSARKEQMFQTKLFRRGIRVLKGFDSYHVS